MNRKIALLFLFFFTICQASSPLFAQKSKGGTPLSYRYNIAPEQEILALKTTASDTKDDATFSNPRIALPIKTDYSLENTGSWTVLPNGTRLWRLTIESENALGLALAFEDIKLPNGAQFFIYSPDGKQILGAYDTETLDNKTALLAGIIKGKRVVVEYSEPKVVTTNGRFRISTIYHVYKNDGAALNDFNDALPCQVNINCAQGTPFQNEKRGVVRILIAAQEGLFWCTGSLINNTAQDGKPYLLSAFHCADGLTPNYSLWTFYFNYESSTCNNPATEPTAQTLQGCVRKAGAKETDFLLLELTQRPTAAHNAYYNGWNRDSSTMSNSWATIHHPQGDIKKISIDNDAPFPNGSTIFWSETNISPLRTHLVGTIDVGTSEPGSSGAPMFDSNKRIIGQLHGSLNQTTNPCINLSTFFGWLAKAWDGGGTAQTRLKDWLDPTNSGVLTLNGTNAPTQQRGTVSGKITQWNGKAMADVKIVIGTDSTKTDANGNFSMGNVLLNTATTVRLSKNDAVDNGVDGADILLIRRYLLGTQNFTSPFSLLAGDVNADGDVDVADILFIRRLVLGIISNFPNNTVWRFVSHQTAGSTSFPNVIDPPILTVTFTGNVSNFNFFGYKSGDVNASAEN